MKMQSFGTMSRARYVAVKAGTRGTTALKTRPVKAEKSGNSLSILKSMQELQLLSKLEELRILSKLEKAGFTLSKIEEAGLLSFAEKSGVLSIIADKNTPGTLNLVGLLGVAGAAGLVYLATNDGAQYAVPEVVGAVLLVVVGLGSLVAGNLLSKLQRL